MRHPRSFIWSFSTALFIGVGLCVAWLVYFDPFWVYRKSPPWLAVTGGANNLIDTENRKAKPLQLLTRGANTVLVGSSVVYRGMDPTPLESPEQRFYNLGLSGIMAYELPVVAAMIASTGSASHVVFGLDYYMFTDLFIPVRVHDSWSGRIGRNNLFVWSLFSWRSLSVANQGAVGDTRERGDWRYNGFRTTPDRPAEKTLAINREQQLGTLAYQEARLNDLKLALRRVSAFGKVTVYLSPINAAQRRIIEDNQLLQQFQAWRRDVAMLAADHGASFFDIVDAPAFDDFDPAAGSSAFWLDNQHFKPMVGEWIFDKIGIQKK